MNTTFGQKTTKRALVKVLLGFGLLSCAWIASATTVQIQTVLGNFEINLYDKQTPKTVENFLAYVESGAYTDSIVHRSVANFVVQGGGFKYEGSDAVSAIPQNPTVINEPVFSNVRGTIAMAKVGNNPNSATNQWFINLKNNSANLDLQNGGFTVFGQVTGNGMAIVDTMAALGRYNLATTARGASFSAFTETPLRNYTAGAVDDDHFVMITGVVVLNPSPDTADELNPPKNISGSNSSTPGNVNPGGSSGGGGSVSINLMGLLLMLGLRFIPGVTGQRRK